MSDALLRVSEAAALDVADVQRQADGSGTLTVRSSKTDQEGRGHVRYLGAPTMQRLAAWLSGAGITTGGPLFRQVLKDGATVTGRLGVRSIRSIIAKRAAAAGVAGRVSGHSLRVGSGSAPGRLRVGSGSAVARSRRRRACGIAGSGRLAGADHAGALRTPPARSTRRRRQAPLPGGPVAAPPSLWTPAPRAGTSWSTCSAPSPNGSGKQPPSARQQRSRCSSSRAAPPAGLRPTGTSSSTGAGHGTRASRKHSQPSSSTAPPASHGRRWPTSSAPPGTALVPAAAGRARARRPPGFLLLPLRLPRTRHYRASPVGMKPGGAALGEISIRMGRVPSLRPTYLNLHVDGVNNRHPLLAPYQASQSSACSPILIKVSTLFTHCPATPQARRLITCRRIALDPHDQTPRILRSINGLYHHGWVMRVLTPYFERHEAGPVRLHRQTKSKRLYLRR